MSKSAKGSNKKRKTAMWHAKDLEEEKNVNYWSLTSYILETQDPPHILFQKFLPDSEIERLCCESERYARPWSNIMCHLENGQNSLILQKMA